MDRPTVDVYESEARRWAAVRGPEGEALTGRLVAERVPGAGPLVDLGCGPGWHTARLGDPVVALDAARAMLQLVPERAPAALRVQASVTALPFRPGSLGGALASRVHVHVARQHLPLALADLHRSLGVGAPVTLVLFAGDAELAPFPGDDFPGRRFAQWDPALLADVVTGAGFAPVAPERAPEDGSTRLTLHARRERTLPDTVGPGMRVLVCGLNPSVYSADRGVGFARPGNRFWPAALAAGLVTRARDPWHALAAHGVGMTDLVKRATPRADELRPEEYREGLARVERLAGWLEPGLVLFVGLAGWRAAVDRRAVAGFQDRGVGGRPVYVMPSTSGLNASSRPADLVEHLRRATAAV